MIIQTCNLKSLSKAEATEPLLKMYSIGLNSHEPYVILMEAGVMAFVAHYTYNVFVMV